VFLPVDDKGRREDGSRVEGIHATKDFKTVYIPPWFRTRIFLFTISIWTFAAVTGVSLTIAPLVVGRMIFKMVLPSFVRTNDIYAFCIGIHVLGLLAYGLFHAKSLMHSLHRWAIKKGSVRPYKNPAELVRLAIRLAGLLYTYTLILVVCPLVMATLIELYINIPLHTFLNPPSSTALRSGKDSSQHNVRIVEAWTLGLLYMRLAIKVINSFVRNTRFARALRAVLRRGWLDPDIRILTKGFVIPGLVVASLAILVPGAIVSLVEGYDGFTADSQDPYQAAAERVMRYRAAYPLTAFIFMALRWSLQMSGKIDTLKAQVRDDAYLMGEQLQNYDSVLGLNVSEDSEPLSRPAGVD
jgi:E3 ubiquitin-protein ligase MARCH6